MDDNDDYIILAIQYFMSVAVAVSTFLVAMTRANRNPSLFDQRLKWNNFRTKHGARADFKRQLRMTPASFDRLLSYIRDDLEVNHSMADLRGGAIIPELCLYCTIRYLAGGSYSDISFHIGISRPSFYRILWKTIKAINNCIELQIFFPKTLDECLTAAEGFKGISDQGCIDNCVCAVDGYHLQIETPWKSEVFNQRSYFSGHYQTHGVNIQAACDHLCRFVFLGVAGPGSMGDRDAVERCGLYSMIEALPGLFTAIGDCAYKPTEHMLSIFGGASALNKNNNNFNFYASQLRIRIEMAFGLMVKKWGILSRPLSISMHNIKGLILAIARLHNFCINERLGLNLSASGVSNDVEFGIQERSLREESSFTQFEAMSDEFPGWSLNRNRMVRNLASLQMTRPGRQNRF